MNTSYMFQFQLKCNELNPLFFFFLLFLLASCSSFSVSGRNRKEKKKRYKIRGCVCVCDFRGGHVTEGDTHFLCLSNGNCYPEVWVVRVVSSTDDDRHHVRKDSC